MRCNKGFARSAFSLHFAFFLQAGLDLGLGRPDEALGRLFTPPKAPAGAYETFVSNEPIAVVTERCRSASWLLGGLRRSFAAVTERTAEPFMIRRLLPLDAFGGAGPYDRGKLARLYGGRRVAVARGPIVRQGRTIASVTLFSPYPDARLERLQEGTMAIVVTLTHF